MIWHVYVRDLRTDRVVLLLALEDAGARPRGQEIAKNAGIMALQKAEASGIRLPPVAVFARNAVECPEHGCQCPVCLDAVARAVRTRM